MRIAYVVSGLQYSMTFVVNEMEEHDRAGWSVLPLVSCPKYSFENLNELMLKWNRRSVFRHGCIASMPNFFKSLYCYPIRTCKVLCWVLSLMLVSYSEGMKALYELFPAFIYADVCRKEKIQHIHVHFASRSLSLGIMVAMLINKPVSCTCHAFDIFMRSAASLRYRLKRCVFVAAISEYNIRYLRSKCGEQISNLCQLVRCGIDVKQFSGQNNGTRSGYLLTISRLLPKKGIENAIRACSRLKKDGIRFRYDIIGSGELLPSLKELIKMHGLNGEVFLLGPKTNTEIRGYLSKASIFVMPCVQDKDGDMDGIPVAMMEAMAYKVPVVSTFISGIPELVIHNDNGWLIPPGDELTLTDTLKKVLGNPGLVRTAGEKARLHVVNNFAIDQNAAKLRQFVEKSSLEVCENGINQ